MEVLVARDPAAAAAMAAELVVASLGECPTLAVSGGSTAPGLFAALAASSAVDWSTVEVWQVDERIAPDGDSDRNANQLATLRGVLHPMPVTASDLDAAAREYAAGLPEHFDVVHLGLGDDGHTASWAPLPHPDAERAITRPDPVFTMTVFNGRGRMTLGSSVVNAARCRVVLVAGVGKAEVVARWVTGVAERGRAWTDPTLPIATVDPNDTLLVLDAAAARALDPGDYSRISQ